MAQARIRKDMTVVVITGSDKDKRGKVITVDRKKERVIVEGINKRRQTLKRSSDNPRGGLVEQECSIHISNVMPAEQYDARRADTVKAVASEQTGGEQ